MSLRRFIRKVRHRASFPAESEAQDSQSQGWQPQGSTTLTTEGSSSSLVPLLPPPAESSPVLPVSPRPRHYRDIIRRFFPLRRRRSSELVGRHAGLGREVAGRQPSLDAILTNLELAGRHAGLGREFAGWLRHPSFDAAMANLELDGRHIPLGFTPQMHEFISGLLERYQYRRALRQIMAENARRQGRENQANVEHDSQHEHGSAMSQARPFQDGDIQGRHPNYEVLNHLENVLASRAARPSPAVVEGENLQRSYEDLLYLPPPNTEADPIQYDPDTMRGFEDVFARQEARNNQANVEDRDSQHAHGSGMAQAFPSQNDEIEGYGFARPPSRMQIRAASSVHSHSSNIPYSSTSHDDNNELRDTDSFNSQVRRGRSLRRHGSSFSNVFPSNHPSRDHSQLYRGRQLIRAASVAADPWTPLWGPVDIPSDPVSQEPYGRRLRRASTVASARASDQISEEPHDRTLRQGSGLISEPASDPVSQEPRGRTLRRASSVASDPANDQISHEPHDTTSRRATSLISDPPNDPSSQERRGRTLRRASSVVSDPSSDSISHEPHDRTPQRASSLASGAPSDPISQERRGRTPRRAFSLVTDGASDSISQEPHRTTPRASSVAREPTGYRISQEPHRTPPRASSVASGAPSDSISQERCGRTLRRASSLVFGGAGDPISREPHDRTRRRGSSLASEPRTVLWESIHRMGDPNDRRLHLPRGASPVSDTWRHRVKAMWRALDNPLPRRPLTSPLLDEIFARVEGAEQTNTRVERWIEQVHQARHQGTGSSRTSPLHSGESIVTLRPGRGSVPEYKRAHDEFCSEVDRGMAQNVITERLYHERRRDARDI
ncbi:hypothetical protein N7491_008600 [Penicillium cf. griseofulvum]|nr:hypothetical protein N7491_008600 [Penicillium cf. griseofulvum]